MQSNFLDSWLSKISPRTALIVARVIAGIVLFFVLCTVIVVLPQMIAAAYHRGLHLATIAAVIIGLLFLCLICIVPTIAAIGLWRGRGWAWWLQFALMILAILRHPPGVAIVALLIVALIVIRDAYLRIDQRT